MEKYNNKIASYHSIIDNCLLQINKKIENEIKLGNRQSTIEELKAIKFRLDMIESSYNNLTFEYQKHISS